MTVRRAEASDVRALAELNALVQDFHVAHEPAVFKGKMREIMQEDVLTGATGLAD